MLIRLAGACLLVATLVRHSRYTAMSNKSSSGEDAGEGAVYQIRVGGQLSERWADWFGGLTITPEGSGDTFLTGSVVDQAALHGLLRKVRDLGMPLISVVRVEPGQGYGDRELRQS